MSSIIGVDTSALLLWGIIIAWVMMVIYNLFLSPLRHLPGPLISQLFPIYDLYFFVTGTFHKHILNLHNQYGPIVRIGGDRVALNHPDAWQEVHATYKYPKSPFYENVKHTGTSMVTLNDRKAHSSRRRTVSRIFSESNAANLESLMLEVGTQPLMKKITSHCQSNPSGSLNMSLEFQYLTLDITGKLLFGKELGILTSENHPLIEWNRYILSRAVMGSVFFPLRFFGNPYLKNIIEFAREAIYLKSQEPLANDILSGLLEAKDPQTGSYLEENDILEECASLLVAGSDSSHHTLNWILYTILKRPEVYKQIQTEIITTFPGATPIAWRTLQTLPYFNAVIKECLRLYPVASLPLLRVVPDSGSCILGYPLPPNTEIFTMNYATHRSSEFWSHPDDFLPNRWLPPHLTDTSHIFFPFSTGPRACPGRHIALLEISLTLSHLIRNFHMTLTEPSLELIPVSYLVLRPQHHHPLLVNFTPRT